ncbi:MAG: NAD kinase [Mycobacteriales bacterium]
MTRRLLLLAHTGRDGAIMHARRAARELSAAGFCVDVLDTEADELNLSGARAVAAAVEGTEIVLALGGDGTVLRAAELARPIGVPLLGVNFGRMGFLTGAEVEDLGDVLARIIARDYHATPRVTVDVSVRNSDGALIGTGWALNEVSLERAGRSRMLDVLLDIDGQPVSRWGCDGVICATPTGSTAYAFSAGGPVVWPSTQALLVVPNAAHALFSRPLVVGPDSIITLTLGSGDDALLNCDGRRSAPACCADVVQVRQSPQPLLLASLTPPDFAQRLVAKFQLPVAGWRRSTSEHAATNVGTDNVSTDNVSTQNVSAQNVSTEKVSGGD